MSVQRMKVDENVTAKSKANDELQNWAILYNSVTCLMIAILYFFHGKSLVAILKYPWCSTQLFSCKLEAYKTTESDWYSF